MRGGVLAEDHELVAAESSERVGRSKGRTDAPGDLGQELVADLVTECVVDRLEAIEVEVHDRERLAVARPLERMEDAVEHQHPVHDAG